MKNIISIFLIYCCTSVYAQVEFIGFDRSVCAEPMNNAYTYSNFNSGGGSGAIYGYIIYKNGIAVFTASGNMSQGKHCKDLIFINDSIGFLVFYSGISSNRVLRTQDFGQTWTDIGGGAPNYFGLYVVNSTTAYLVTQWDIPMQLRVARCSSIPSNINSNLIYDQTIDSDIFETDTLLYSDLCNQESLDFKVLNGTDTITYHINFNLEFIGIENEFDDLKTELSVYPNPSSDFFQFSNLSAPIESVSLFSINGVAIRSYESESIFNNHFSLSSVSNGSYIIRVDHEGGGRAYTRLIVNNVH